MKKLKDIVEKVTGREVDLNSKDDVSPNFIMLILGLLIMIVYALSS